MIGRLLGVLALLGIAAFLRVVLRGSRVSAPSRPSGVGPGSPRFEGALVRDRVCGTFLPRAKALVLREASEEVFFCSEACRTAHLGRLRAAKTA